MTQLLEFRRLIEQIERDLGAQAGFRTLLAAGDTILARHRRELRSVMVRLKRNWRSGGERTPR